MNVFSPENAVLPSAEAGWVYLGKDAQRRAAAQRRLAKAPEPVSGLLRAEAKRLRGPFLDFVAGLGEPFEKDRALSARWHSGTLAWKAWAASDLFLLCCYRNLAAWLGTSERKLAVVVEDAWLRAELNGEPAPSRERTGLLILGVLRRLKWAGRLAGSLAKLRAAGAKLPERRNQDTVLLYSHLLAKSLGSPWNDHYMPGLAERLRSEGKKVWRFVDPGVTGFEAELAKRREDVVATLLAASLSDILRCALAAPLAVSASASLEGKPMAALLEREWWSDFSRNGASSFLLMKTLVERLYARLTPRAVYLPFENMPQDKMILLAAREAHVAAIGEQHTTVPAMQLNFFLGRGESLRAPLPGMLRCAGVVSMEKLAAGGWARERLTLGGSRRFPKPPQELPPAASPKDVLVVLPIDAAMTQDLLAALRASYPQGPRDFRFVIQPHPAEPLAAEQLPPGAELSASGFRDNLGRCGRVLSCGTLAGLEALLAGRQLLRYRCDAQLDLDPLEDLPDSVLPTAGAWNLADKLEKLDENDAALRSQARALWDGLFAAPQEAAR